MMSKTPEWYAKQADTEELAIKLFSQAMQQARKEALEEAERECKKLFETSLIGNGACLGCAAVIRALKNKERS